MRRVNITERVGDPMHHLRDHAVTSSVTQKEAATSIGGKAMSVREQQAQILFALGVMGYSPWGKRPYVFGETFATSCFDWAANTAKARGFKGRKQLIAAVRRGRATTFAILKMQEACSFLTEAEIAFHLARSASIVHFMDTGRQMPGWTFKDPVDARASFRGTANV